MNGSASDRQSVEFKDRRTGLLIFGILEILLGCLCVLLLVLLMGTFVMASYSESAGGLGVYGFAGSMDWHVLGFAVVIYLGLAALFLCLGIGSIYCQRWAYTLNLVLSWSWLLGGVIASCLFLLLVRSVVSTGNANSDATLILTTAGVLQGIFLVALPAAMVVFFSGRHVKATCEARDPVRRWTDACPLPVLASALWIGLGALSLLTMPLIYHSVVPFFGTLIAGFPATLMVMLFSALWFYIAWATYRLRMAGWWLGLTAFAVLTASLAITFVRVDLLEMYRRLGYPEDQIRILENSGFFTRGVAVWSSAAFFATFVLYSIWIKKYFRRQS